MIRGFVFFFFISIQLSSQVLWQINTDTIIVYNYNDGDEFSGTEVSQEKWKSWYGWARSIYSNKEQQYYSEFKNHEVKDGCLYITPKREDLEAKMIDWMGDNDSIKSGGGKFYGLNKRSWKYTSGLIQTKKEFLRGYFEIKFKAPSEKGLWPAFWVYGGSPNEEIDFMELKGEREDQIHVDTHCRDCDMVRNFIGQKRSFGGWIKLDGKLNEGFNVVSGSWDENEVRYYLNGKCIAISKVQFSKPKALAANVAIADDKGPFHPGPDKNTKEFSPFIIDYIRVWSKEDGQEDQVLKTTDANPKPDNTEAKRHPKMLYGKKADHSTDGIFVSVFPKEDGTLKLFCNGLDRKESYSVKISEGDKILFNETTSERELELPFKISGNTRVEVSWRNRTAAKTF
jgi:beta-glucanase (GH16 family)